MNDDREVTRFALAGEPMIGKDAKEAGMAAWLAQKDGDDGCAFLGTTMAEARLIGAPEVAEDPFQHRGQPAARRAPGRRPARPCRRRHGGDPRQPGPVCEEGVDGDAQRPRTTIALLRLATSDSDSAAALLASR